ncbi:signal peptidase complex subunit 1-like [Liolophura sinensis]|uniref:signal peptidase complex subunit 1-like n=1 Tax=Liolophura sinensis TaxID=3198878 RepID=UPI003158FE45
MEYIIPLIPESIRRIPTHMDFEGQRKAEKTFQVIIVLFAVVGFIWGYVCQQFSQTMYMMLAGFALSCVLTLPPWPMYRTKPLPWLKVQREPESEPQTAPSIQQKTKRRK